MIKEKDIAWATERLMQKYNDLGRLPKKDDFDELTRSRIKSYLGPWPRALEKAGLKQTKAETKNKKKRKNKGKSVGKSNTNE